MPPPPATPSGDKWSVGNLYQEPCTGSGNEAQVTDAAKRILNENNPPVFTDSGDAKVEQQFNAAGKAVFNANVAAVTVTGNNAFIPASALEHVGYLYGWEATFTVDMADSSRCGRDWKEATPGPGRRERIRGHLFHRVPIVSGFPGRGSRGLGKISFPEIVHLGPGC